MIHAVKCKKEYFELLMSNKKTFEVRNNDRDYRVGDYLAINEVDCKNENILRYTGQCMLFEIIYVFDDEMFLKPGNVILGIEPVTMESGGKRYRVINDFEKEDTRCACDNLMAESGKNGERKV